MRKKRWFKAQVGEHPEGIFSDRRPPKEFAQWLEAKRHGRPLVLELGMGTGDFLLHQALQQPEMFFLGVEVKPDRIFRAFRKAVTHELSHMAFLQSPVEKLESYELPMADHLYLLFPDPWPKKKHLRRRMTGPAFLKRYISLLRPEGVLTFKTDDGALFLFTKESLKQSGWTILKSTENDLTPPEAQTGYERGFRKQGKTIFSLTAQSSSR